MTVESSSSHPSRAAVVRLSLVFAVACLVWAAVILAIDGGPDFRIAGLRIRSHDPFKPLLAAALALTVRVLAGGTIPLGWLWVSWRAGKQLIDAIASALGLIKPAQIAWVLAIGLFALCVTLGTRTIGGSDSYGYVSEADLWLKGQLKVDQSFALELPWPAPQDAFAPLTYLSWSQDRHYIVPTVAPGLPLLLALAKLIGGHAAVFWVVPLGAAALVLGTFYLVRRLASPTAGAIAAWLVALSPPVLYLSMTTMTDVPNAAVWTAAFCVLLRRRTWSELCAGVLCSLAVMIRPNLGPLVAFFALDIFVHYKGWAHPLPALRRVALFCIGVVPGAAVVSLFNAYVFGSTLAHGSGNFSHLVAWSNVGPNVRNYVGYLLETHTPLALLGVAAMFVPLRVFWPNAGDRRVFISIGLFTAALWAFYFAYDILPAWWYLRFMLPTWPFIIGGLAAVIAALMRLRIPFLKPVIICGLIALGVLQWRTARDRWAMALGRGEARYIIAAQLARRVTVPNSVIISIQHVGSARYYSGRMTIRYDRIEHGFDRTVDWFTSHGVHTYALLEEWEVPDITSRFGDSQRLKASLAAGPIGIYRDPELLFIYDLSTPPAAGTIPVTVTGLDTGAGFGAVGPIPVEPLVFK